MKVISNIVTVTIFPCDIPLEALWEEGRNYHEARRDSVLQIIARATLGGVWTGVEGKHKDYWQLWYCEDMNILFKSIITLIFGIVALFAIYIVINFIGYLSVPFASLALVFLAVITFIFRAVSKKGKMPSTYLIVLLALGPIVLFTWWVIAVFFWPL